MHEARLPRICPPNERRLYIEQAAVRRNVSPVVLEKDFWVCWLLGILFESEFAGSLVFKGGTSLSKVFGVIERFSEDIDLSLSPAFLKLPEAGTSRNQANKWMAKAEAACGAAVKTQIAPALEAAVEAVLGKSETGVVRVPDGPPHELAGAPVPLPIVAAGGVRVPQTLGEAGIRLAHRPAADRPPSGAAVGGRCPAR